MFLSSIVALAACTPDDRLARVGHVIDGDTLIVTIDDRQERVCLSRINAPEIKAACQEEMMRGIGARAYMEGLVTARYRAGTVPVRYRDPVNKNPVRRAC